MTTIKEIRIRAAHLALALEHAADTMKPRRGKVYDLTSEAPGLLRVCIDWLEDDDGEDEDAAPEMVAMPDRIDGDTLATFAGAAHRLYKDADALYETEGGTEFGEAVNFIEMATDRLTSAHWRQLNKEGRAEEFTVHVL